MSRHVCVEDFLVREGGQREDHDALLGNQGGGVYTVNKERYFKLPRWCYLCIENFTVQIKIIANIWHRAPKKNQLGPPLSRGGCSLSFYLFLLQWNKNVSLPPPLYSRTYCGPFKTVIVNACAFG